MMMCYIEYHQVTYDAVTIEEITRGTSYVNKGKVRTVCGWKLCVRCKHGSINYIALKDLK